MRRMADPTPSLPSIPRPCNQPGCTTATRNTGGRCNEHTRTQRDEHNAATAYYRTAEWTRLRAQRIAMDYAMCVVCTSTRRLVAHHIKARRDGGPDTLANLTTVCQSCHSKIEAGEGNATRLMREHLRYRPA